MIKLFFVSLKVKYNIYKSTLILILVKKFKVSKLLCLIFILKNSYYNIKYLQMKAVNLLSFNISFLNTKA